MKLRQDRKEKRKREAKERQEAYNKLSPQQKIASLDNKLGKGIGATKQRAKLQKEIETAKETKEKKSAKTETSEKKPAWKKKEYRK